MIAVNSKPKLETQSDVDIKNLVKKFLMEDQSCKIHDLYERMYYADWFCSNIKETRYWFSEFKRRHISHDQYPEGTILSLHKYLRLREYSMFTGNPSQFVVLFNDGLFYHTVRSDNKQPLSFQGRNDRGHDGDVEPCVMIVPDQFSRVAGWKEWMAIRRRN